MFRWTAICHCQTMVQGWPFDTGDFLLAGLYFVYKVTPTDMLTLHNLQYVAVVFKLNKLSQFVPSHNKQHGQCTVWLCVCVCVCVCLGKQERACWVVKVIMVIVFSLAEKSQDREYKCAGCPAVDTEAGPSSRDHYRRQEEGAEQSTHKHE